MSTVADRPPSANETEPATSGGLVAGARSRLGGFAGGVVLISLLAFALRVAYILLFRTDMTLGGDQYHYSVGADLLADGHGFIEPLMFRANGVVEQSAAHPPLYLVWLAIASWLDPRSVDSHQTLHMIWSSVLGTGSVVLTALAGREIRGPRVGLIAAGLAAVYPNVWLHDGMLLSETSAVFMSAACILTAYRYWNRPGLGRAALLGFSCGLAALSVSPLILTVPLLLVPVVLRKRGVAFPRRVQWLAVAGVVAGLALMPWIGLNLTRFDEPVYLSTNFGGVLAATNCDATYSGELIGFKNYECAEEYYSRVRSQAADGSETDALVRAEVMEYVRANRDRVPVVVAARMARIAGVFNPRQDIVFDQYFYSRESWAAHASIYSYYPVVLLAFAGAVVLRRQRQLLIPLLAMPVIVLISVAITFAQTRYRAPAEIALVLLAAVAVDAFLRRRHRSGSPAA